MPDNYPLFEDKFPTPSVVGIIVMLSLKYRLNIDGQMEGVISLFLMDVLL